MTTSPQHAELPLTAHLAGQRVVVVGAGAVAAGKVTRLLEAGAVVCVVAPEAVPGIAAAARAGRVDWQARAFAPHDLDGAVLVVAATADEQVNAAVAEAAAARATLCVRADGGGTAAFAAAVRRGPLLVSVSTGGAAPALARRLRVELDERYGPEYATLAALLGELRREPEIRAALGALPAAARSARWQAVLDADILRHIRAGHLDQAKEVARSCLLSSSD